MEPKAFISDKRGMIRLMFNLSGAMQDLKNAVYANSQRDQQDSISVIPATKDELDLPEPYVDKVRAFRDSADYSVFMRYLKRIGKPETFEQFCDVMDKINIPSGDKFNVLRRNIVQHDKDFGEKAVCIECDIQEEEYFKASLSALTHEG